MTIRAAKMVKIRPFLGFFSGFGVGSPGWGLITSGGGFGGVGGGAGARS